MLDYEIFKLLIYDKNDEIYNFILNSFDKMDNYMINIPLHLHKFLKNKQKKNCINIQYICKQFKTLLYKSYDKLKRNDSSIKLNSNNGTNLKLINPNIHSIKRKIVPTLITYNDVISSPIKQQHIISSTKNSILKDNHPSEYSSNLRIVPNNIRKSIKKTIIKSPTFIKCKSNIIDDTKKLQLEQQVEQLEHNNDQQQVGTIQINVNNFNLEIKDQKDIKKWALFYSKSINYGCFSNILNEILFLIHLLCVNTISLQQLAIYIF